MGDVVLEKLTDIKGIKIGNAQDLNAGTGCTVILCEDGAVAGVDVRGGSPGTRETDLLDPRNIVSKIHAVVLAGGSAFGLDAASGVMQYLEEAGIGFDALGTKVPVVCSAILFDLNCGDYKVKPDKKQGYEACLNAQYNECSEGNIGAGTGATIGKIKGFDYAMKGGLGTYCIRAGELLVGAIVAVNCMGDIFDSETGKIIAGVLNDDKKTLGNTEKIMVDNYANIEGIHWGNTTIGVIVTNAQMSKAEANKLATMAHDGYARAIKPSHAIFDGDTIFSMSTNQVKADISVVGLLAAKAMEKAIIRGIKSADSCHGYKAFKELNKVCV